MTDINLSTIVSGYNLSAIENNFSDVEQVINEEVLHTEGGNNVMQQQLDMNGQRILNLPAPVFPTDVVRLIDLNDDGSVDVDLSGYYTSEEIDALLEGYYTQAEVDALLAALNSRVPYVQQADASVTMDLTWESKFNVLTTTAVRTLTLNSATSFPDNAEIIIRNDSSSSNNIVISGTGVTLDISPDLGTAIPPGGIGELKRWGSTNTWSFYGYIE